MSAMLKEQMVKVFSLMKVYLSLTVYIYHSRISEDEGML